MMEKYTHLLLGHGYKILDEYDEEMEAEEICDNMESLEIHNAALLEALEEIADYMLSPWIIKDTADKAIRKAKGE
jgi:hypothetical protein